MNLQHLIQEKFRAALTGLVDDVQPFAAMVKPTQDAKHGDYQANCAMSLKKQLGKNPRDIAQEIVGRLELGDLLQPPEIAGPGFINLRLQDAWMAKQLQSMAMDERLGVTAAAPSKTFVIDYSSPNVAKPLHVGHLRSTIIGDSLTRLLRFLGHTVVTDNHLGDWGTQFGILLYGYKNLLDQEAYQKNPLRELARLYVGVRNIAKTFDILAVGFHSHRNDAAFQADPMTELARLYVNGMKRERMRETDASEDDDDAAKGPNPIADCCRAETAKLHHGDPENNELWRQFMPHCLAEIHEVYEKLGILPFDYEHGESFYNPMLAGVVDSLLQANVAEHGEAGAIIVRLSESDVALVRKRDGAFTYMTSDLATIQHRLKEFKPDAIVYVVDFRQGKHFENLFAAARRWGIANVELTHISFGSVLGKDGKPISTRKGDGTELIDLINKAVEVGNVKYLENFADRVAAGHEVPHVSKDERQQIAEAVGIGAIKYADLSQNRTSDYKFDYDKMLATEGNTATYMQYAYARNRSIFRKGNEDVQRFRTQPPLATLQMPQERALAVQLLRLEETLLRAAEEYQPSEITSHLWDLAKTYSGFFQNCPVLKADTPELRDSRLLLCDLTARVIQCCLQLLGIRTVERM